MLSYTYAPELADVLVAFFFWLSTFVVLMALVVVVLLGLSVFRMTREAVTTCRPRC